MSRYQKEDGMSECYHLPTTHSSLFLPQKHCYP
jgi:hypothetical protein